MTGRAVLWCAVSTRPQAGEDKNSLGTQESDQREACERLGLDVIDVLSVPGHSRRYYDIETLARDARREGIDAFDRLMQHWAVRDFDVLVVRDGDRFARTQSLHARVVEETIEGGARIYSLADGWVDGSNYRMWGAMNGYRAASDVDSLVKKHHAGMKARVARGLPVRTPPLFHKTLWENGKAIRLEVDEDKRALSLALAEALLDGVPWLRLSEFVAYLGHLNPKTNKPYSPNTFYVALYSPNTWGHSALQYSGRHYSRWVYEDSCNAIHVRRSSQGIGTGDTTYVVPLLVCLKTNP